jgi:hypothetical protein
MSHQSHNAAPARTADHDFRSTDLFMPFGFGGGLIIVAILAIAVRIHLIGQPMDRDEGHYAYIGQQMLNGGVPYRDVFSDKPPVDFLIYAGFLAIFGQSAMGIHLGGALWVAGTACLFAELGRRLYGPTCGLLAGVLYAVSSAEGTFQGSSINMELILTPTVVGAFLLLVDVVTLRRCFLAGVLLGVAMLTKQTAIGHAVFAAIWVFLRWRMDRRHFRELLGLETLLLVGALVPLCVSLLLFWLAGGLGAYIDGVLLYNIQDYVVREPLSRAWGNFADNFFAILAGNPLLYAAAAVGGVICQRDAPRTRWFALIWLLTNAAAMSIGLRFYKHYFLLPLPAVLLMGCRAAGAVITRFFAASRSAPIAIAALSVACPLVLQFDYFFRWTPWEHVQRLYGEELFAESQRIADHVAQHTTPDEPLFIWGFETQINFLARRRAPARYTDTYPLTARGLRALERQKEAAEALESERPPFILTVAAPMSVGIEYGNIPYLEQRLQTLLRTEYKAVWQIQIRPHGVEYVVTPPDGAVPVDPNDPAEAIFFERRDRSNH